jgi:hypothetical protein
MADRMECQRMRSTPARALRKDQLLLDQYDVNKITSVEYPIPQNIVTVHLKDQMTGEESTRDLRWDQHLSTEEPLEVEIGESGKITIELAQMRDDEDRPVYRYRVTDEAAGIDHEAADLSLGALVFPSNTKAARVLLGELEASAEAFAEGHAIEADAFPESVNVWAANHSAAIEMAQLDLGGGLERSLRARRTRKRKPSSIFARMWIVAL